MSIERKLSEIEARHAENVRNMNLTLEMDLAAANLPPLLQSVRALLPLATPAMLASIANSFGVEPDPIIAGQGQKFVATKAKVFNRGVASDAFLAELVDWGKTAPEDIFAPNDKPDIYGKVRTELGPWTGPLHRRAVMLEVMRVLALFESSANHKEGVDTSRLGDDTPENSEAGAWQVSYDARRLAPMLAALLTANNIRNGIEFQRAMKFNHALAMEFVARLMRHDTKHNGPLYKGAERNAIRASLRGPEHSIYPWLRRDAVAEFERLLA